MADEDIQLIDLLKAAKAGVAIAHNELADYLANHPNELPIARIIARLGDVYGFVSEAIEKEETE